LKQSAKLAMASSMPCVTQLRSPLVSPDSHCWAWVEPERVAGMRWRALMDSRGRGDADYLSGAWSDGGGGERGGPGAMALLVLRSSIVAQARVSGLGILIHLGKVEGEVRSDVGVHLVDTAVENCDTDAFAHGDVPGAVRVAAGNVVAVAADLLDAQPCGVLV
jgi:hypothetical protein